MTRFWTLLVLLACALVGAGPAAAHTRSESHSAWTIDGAVVHLNFSVADLEAKRITADGGRPGDAALVAYLGPRLGVTAEGKPCKLAAPPRLLAAAPGFRRAEFQYACPSPRSLRLVDHAFFELVSTHVNFAQVQRPDGDFAEQLITADDQGLDLGEGEGGGLQSAGFLRFVLMGVLHIFTGVDHQSFLLGLVLISRRLRDLVFVVTGFTIGHSLTLALAVTGIIRPHAEYIDALVALTIALIGAENVSVASGRPGTVALWTGGGLMLVAGLRLLGIGLLPPLLLIGSAIFAANYIMVSGHLRDAGRVRLVVTLVFGLIHGFGFAADLLESKLPPEKLAEILVGFNVGVEIGQLTIVLALTGLVLLLTRVRLTLPRPIVVDVCAAGLVAVGSYWFMARSFA
ncbi:HupE/UreJ family protein [Sphingomonas bacterium]|uniref:HupE/UreJ family protein n=1 Tax=Sphingomonas bacterium TaxID=1895847 RepID=UPI001576D279|nr:HupE/UreJ family protein [Sphingomonas bacterium]